MAKKKLPDVAEFERRHNETIEAYLRRIDRIYARAAREAAAIAAGTAQSKPGKVFSFDDLNVQARKAIDEVFRTMQRQILDTISTGTANAWLMANLKNDQLVKAVLDDELLGRKIAQKYLSNNGEALQAYRARKVAGLNLSDRVWSSVDIYRNELELVLDRGIATGQSAAKMATEAKQYLSDPDKLFRRVRDDRGELQLSKAARAYHPGTGKYRSSYMNAKRLTVTETNTAYRSADQLRTDNFDFVVGKRIVRANKVVFCPICSFISDQVYPKTYVFTGNHPFCKCFIINVLMTKEELQILNRALLNGEEIKIKSVNEVSELPDAFKSWLADNKEKLLRAKTKPFFITQNNIKLG